MNTDRKVVGYKRLKHIRKHASRRGQSVVLITGCYDLLHLGHIITLTRARKEGSILVVALGNDATLRALKGESRPIFPEKVRARMLAALAVVSYVVISREHGKMDHTKIVELLRPDVYVVPGDDSMLQAKYQLVEKVGARVVLVGKATSGPAAGMSTTKTVSKLQGES